MPKRPIRAHVAGKLDTLEVDELFQTVVGWGAPSPVSRCIIDLTDLRFMSPAGLTSLVQSAAYLKRRGWSVSIRFPARDEVNQYLARMGLRSALRGLGRCLGAPRSTRRYRASTALVELTPIRETGDVNRLLGGLSSKVAGILETELGYTGADVGNFCNVISELSRNIIDHSQATGYVAAQRYTRHADGRRFAFLSVGDIGVGLRATLEQRYPVESWADDEVIIRALLPEYSRHPNRGLGLAFVKKICRDYQGSLHLRSGRCRIYIRGGRAIRVDGGWFPGTQVAISLQERAA